MIFVGFFAFWVVVKSKCWYMLRISESVPGPQLADTKLRNDPEVSERSWRTTKPRPAICTVLAVVILLILSYFQL
jgi:hypothetical protein